MKQSKTKPAILRELADGLVIRRTTSADAARLSAFNKQIFLTDDTEEPDEEVAAWTRDLLRGNHPTFRPDDFVVVEQAETGKIVSSTCLIDQTWTYAGIPFGVGRPELVATLPEYRRRGLIRQLFEVVHGWSDERGHKLQAITGIPWYYRQFGYEMALDLGGGRQGFAPANIPVLKKGERERFLVRPAAEEDLRFITRLWNDASRRSLVSEVRDEAIWRYDLLERNRRIAFRIGLIETSTGDSIGLVVFFPNLTFNTLQVAFYELVPGVSYGEVTPSVIRYLKASGENLARRLKREFSSFHMNLGAQHPVYEAMSQFMPRERQPYAWYIRIPDLPGFVQMIAPALDKRLAGSSFSGYSGELKLNFYRSGMRIVLEKGCVTRVEAWVPGSTQDGDAAFPEKTFLMTLMGYRSVQELRHVFADVWTNSDQIRALINVLFPKQPSRVWGIA